jgi:hypothetical protein
MRYSVHGFYAPALAGLLLAAPAFGEDAVRQLEAELTASPSATQFLTDKCAALKLASPPVIKAVRAHEMRPAGAEVRKWLDVGTDTVLGYRRVQLACGAHVLSEADNWYVPGRLTPEMNHRLDTSDTPFGAVVKPLNFHRNTLKMEALDEPAHALRVTAVLVTADGKPFSLVVENYSRELTGDH